MKTWLGFSFYLFFASAILSCASRATPSGGPRDEQPPSIIEEESTVNHQTMFKERRIVLEMDEWVKLEDAQTQLLVSPPLQHRPDIRLRGRQVIFEFDDDEELRENATYTINFGNAIQDLTEGNPLENFSFVFSTGAQIDSLSIRGNIIDAYTGEPLEDILIMVHESAEDSIIYNEKPFYASRTDEEGNFEINNMKEGFFKITAIRDENLNYTYEPASEEIAFIDTMFYVADNFPSTINMALSNEDADLYLDRLDTSGWNMAAITYSRIPYEVYLSYAQPDNSLVASSNAKNPIQIWYYSDSRSRWEVFLTDSTQGIIDTIILRKDAERSEVPTIKKMNDIRNSGHPEDPFLICFDRPIITVDTNRIRLLRGRDSIAISPQIVILDSLPQCIALTNSWSADSIYRLTLYPGALRGLSGITIDTINEQIPIGNEERFGTVIIHLDNLDSTEHYLLELMENDQARKSVVVKESVRKDLTISKMRPGTYKLRVTEDRNQNGRWDPAHYKNHIQPEPTKVAEIEPLRANWDVEVNFKWTIQ